MSLRCRCGARKVSSAYQCRMCDTRMRRENGNHAWAHCYADLQSANRALGLCQKVTAGGRGIVSELTVCNEKATRSGLCPAHRWQVMRW